MVQFSNFVQFSRLATALLVSGTTSHCFYENANRDCLKKEQNMVIKVNKVMPSKNKVLLMHAATSMLWMRPAAINLYYFLLA
jgi:hypothetical protein